MPRSRDTYVPTFTPAEQQKATHLRASNAAIEDAGLWYAAGFMHEGRGNHEAAAYARRAAEAALGQAREAALKGYALDTV